MFPSVEVLIVLLKVVLAAAYMCANIDSLSLMRRAIVIDGRRFRTIDNIGLMGCIRECKARKMCRSVNFALPQSRCALNQLNSSQTTSSNSYELWSSSDIDDWPNNLLGECQGHTCALNEKCEVSSAGVKTCVVEGCLTPPIINNGDFAADGKLVWSFSSIVEFTCSFGFEADGELRCQHGGTWSMAVCVAAAPPLMTQEGNDDDT